MNKLDQKLKNIIEDSELISVRTISSRNMYLTTIKVKLGSFFQTVKKKDFSRNGSIKKAINATKALALKHKGVRI